MRSRLFDLARSTLRSVSMQTHAHHHTSFGLLAVSDLQSSKPPDLHDVCNFEAFLVELLLDQPRKLHHVPVRALHAAVHASSSRGRHIHALCKHKYVCTQPERDHGSDGMQDDGFKSCWPAIPDQAT